MPSVFIRNRIDGRTTMYDVGRYGMPGGWEYATGVATPEPVTTPALGSVGASYLTDPSTWSTVSYESSPDDWASQYVSATSLRPRVPTSSYAPTLSRRREPEVAPECTHTVLDFVEPLHKIYGRKPVYSENKTESYIGLELENEAQQPFELPRVSGWNHHDEGSLRNFGFEYVQSEPAPVKESKRRVGVLLRALRREMEGQSCLNSIRTSVHVHFDVLHYNYFDILNFSIVYWLLEGFISDFCGDSRKGNLFCLRLKDASVAQDMITKAIKNRSPYSNDLMSDNYRYASLNLASLQKFGSLEFRIMRGTDSFEDICTWVDVLESIKQFALKFDTPASLREYFLSSDNPAEDLPRRVFGDDLYKILLGYVRDKSRIAHDIREAYMTVSPILSADKTFNFDKEIIAEKKNQEKIKEQRAAQEKAHAEALQQAIAAQQSGDNETAGEDEVNDQIEVYIRELEEPFINAEGDY